MRRTSVSPTPGSAPASPSIRRGASLGSGWSVYPANLEAGEDVRVIGKRESAGQLPTADYWLFDDDQVALLVYDDYGSVQYVKTYRDAEHVEAALRGRGEALRLATPLARYVAEHNLTERKHAA